ncbi:hypothetical protein Pfo_020515 [Paulownia fortunei]|nr:hypothetical protein Pfo_020515 [Paulownia fortunei]
MSGLIYVKKSGKIIMCYRFLGMRILEQMLNRTKERNQEQELFAKSSLEYMCSGSGEALRVVHIEKRCQELENPWQCLVLFFVFSRMYFGKMCFARMCVLWEKCIGTCEVCLILVWENNMGMEKGRKNDNQT